MASSSPYSPYSPYSSPFSSSSSSSAPENLDYQTSSCPASYHEPTYYCNNNCNNWDPPRPRNRGLWNSDDKGWYEERDEDQDGEQEESENSEEENDEHKENEQNNVKKQERQITYRIYADIPSKRAIDALWSFLERTRNKDEKAKQEYRMRAKAVRKLRRNRILNGAQKWELAKVYVHSPLQSVESVDAFS